MVCTAGVKLQKKIFCIVVDNSFIQLVGSNLNIGGKARTLNFSEHAQAGKKSTCNIICSQLGLEKV